MPASVVKVGTRGSRLALAQTRTVLAALAAAHAGVAFEQEIVRTVGDQTQAPGTPLAEIGGVGVFTKELETALTDGRVDMAVHSLKDLPTQSAPGLCIGAVLEREDVHDAFVSRTHEGLAELPMEATVGTSSVRRAAQLLAFRPDLQVRNIRGNVETRLRKLRDGEYDAIVLAYAGLKRLDLQAEATEVLPLDVMLPAPAQGAVAVQCRDEARWRELLAPIHHAPSAAAARAERGFLDSCGGGCSVPVAAYARVAGTHLELEGAIVALTGAKTYRGSTTGSAEAPDAVGRALAAELLGQGAGAIIDEVLRERGA